MLKERMGGTEGDLAKRDEARRIVPSPPKVATRSTLEERWVGEEMVSWGLGGGV